MNSSIIKTRKVNRQFKIETAKHIWIDEFICLKSEKYASKNGIDSKNNLKKICKSQSKNINSEKKMFRWE